MGANVASMTWNATVAFPAFVAIAFGFNLGWSATRLLLSGRRGRSARAASRVRRNLLCRSDEVAGPGFPASPVSLPLHRNSAAFGGTAQPEPQQCAILALRFASRSADKHHGPFWHRLAAGALRAGLCPCGRNPAGRRRHEEMGGDGSVRQEGASRFPRFHTRIQCEARRAAACLLARPESAAAGTQPLTVRRPIANAGSGQSSDPSAGEWNRSPVLAKLL